MNRVLFFIGAVTFAAGAAGCAIVLLRHVGGGVPKWRTKANLLFAVAALVIGLYLILDVTLLLPVWLALITGATVYSTRKNRELSGESGGE
jgi:Kef-type K+ transport system membrane component KefB